MHVAAQRDALAAQLHEAREKEGILSQRADELVQNEARAQMEVTVWKEAHEKAASTAMALEVDRGQLLAQLQEQRRRARSLDKQAEQREAEEREKRQQEGEQAAAAAAAAAELPLRLAAARQLDASHLLVNKLACSLTADEHDNSRPDTLSIQQRLRDHSNELQEESRQIQELREALDARSSRPNEATHRAKQCGRSAKDHASKYTCSATLTPRAAGAHMASSGHSSAQLSVPSMPPYHIQALGNSMAHEDTWWECYRRDVLLTSGPSVLELE